MSSAFDRGTRGDNPLGVTVLSAVPADPRSNGLSYEPFYGLKEQPFSLSPDPRYFYRSRQHATSFEELRHAIERRERVMVVSGDVGTGKTTLWRAVCADVDAHLLVALVPDPAVSRGDFLKSLLADFDAGSAEDLPARLKGASEAELRQLLCAQLRSVAAASAIALVVIDEAQNMSAAVADELNVLTDSDAPFQAILVGQIDLAERLASREMHRLDQRASARCTLAPLDRAGVAGYVAYRLQKAGGSPDRVSFSEAAVGVLYERSNGVPRLVNRLCDRALAAAHARRAAVIEADMIQPGESPAVQSAPNPTACVIAPPSSERIDAVDAWIATIDDRSSAPAATVLPGPPAAQPDAVTEPMAYAPAPRAGGIVLCIRITRRKHTRRHRRLERRSDRWARRVANILLALTLLLASAMGGSLLRLW